MKCTVCKKNSEEVELFKGILPDGMAMVCDACAEREEIPIIKAPSEHQLDKADKRYSVRERMERMSGVRDTTEISGDQMVTQGNLAKLRIPLPKEHHEDILDNYYWTLNLARRRKKLTTSQLAEKMQVNSETIVGIEKGKLPENFQELFIKLEAFLGIKLLKAANKQIHFTRTVDEKKEILEDVRKRMEAPESVDEYHKDGIALKEQIASGKIDFSRREELSDVTLNDLVDMKKKKEASVAIKQSKEAEDAMLGDDLDLDLELL
jgi:ribosome-binding protein aMBF1 (putative translation factor)